MTGHPFNGGLQCDDTELPTPLHYVVQPASRIGDVSHSSRLGVLPLFHIIGCANARDAVGASLDLGLDYLVNVVGLDRQRLRLTGTEKARPLFPVMAHYGVNESQMRLVDWQGRLKVCPHRPWRACQHWVWSAGFTAPDARNPFCCSRPKHSG